jgi:glycosyltransferase involved in cell wall biosynthesis
MVLRWSPIIKKSGQTVALDAGIKESKGEIIITMDSDLQNPPEEIPNLLKKLEDENLDVVSGWRQKRQDSIFIKNLSKLGAWMRTQIINPGVHDLGCTLKAYRRECFEGIDLYGEMHRYIVAILRWRGFRVGEIVVKHYERKNGKSFYNWKKMFRGFVDMWQVWFWKKYADRPLHLFGVGGIFLSLAGTGVLCALGILRIFGLITLSNSIWPLISVLMIIVGVQLFIFGMIIDVMVKTYYSIGNDKGYVIKEVIEVK